MGSVADGLRVSVVIVSYNTREALIRCIESIGPDYETIVVDNASTDGTREALATLQGVRTVLNETNLGFGAANNQGIRVAPGGLVLLLNSDARTKPGAIAELASVFQDPGVVAAGGKLLNEDGSLQESCANKLSLWCVFCEQLWLEKLFRGSRLFSPYWMSSRLIQTSLEPQEVHQVMGACLMMRPKELFDERFFLYCEDTELCERLRAHGKILYVPKAEFIHELGASSSSRWKAVAMYNVGKELYFRIHRGQVPSIFCLLLDRLGAFLRLAAWGVAAVFTLGLVERFRKQAALFARVFFAPASYYKLR